MAKMAKTVRAHERACTVEVSPQEVDAGGEVTVAVRASCRHGCNLLGHGVSIRNRDGTELAATELNGDACVTTAVVLQTPLDAGEHTLRAVLAAVEKDGILHQETAAECSFATKAHAASVNV